MRHRNANRTSCAYDNFFCQLYLIIYNDHISVCAYNNIDKVSTCKGDSGGPMYGREAGTGVDGEDNSQEPWTLLGITSFGTTRRSTVGARPAVFTKVSFYIDWIKEHLQP